MRRRQPYFISRTSYFRICLSCCRRFLFPKRFWSRTVQDRASGPPLSAISLRNSTAVLFCSCSSQGTFKCHIQTAAFVALHGDVFLIWTFWSEILLWAKESSKHQDQDFALFSGWKQAQGFWEAKSLRFCPILFCSQYCRTLHQALVFNFFVLPFFPISRKWRCWKMVIAIWQNTVLDRVNCAPTCIPGSHKRRIPFCSPNKLYGCHSHRSQGRAHCWYHQSMNLVCSRS